MNPDPQFRVLRQSRNAVLLEAKHGREANIEEFVGGPAVTAVVPIAEIRLPEAAEMPIARLDEFLVPIPLRADAIRDD